ncbi:MAG: energy transducer TonB [Muribaculaceae bacterium]|nr:energy transducer TonB [Muribaculaceae bacterium]
MLRKLFCIVSLLIFILPAKASDEPTFPGGDAALTKFINDNLHYPEVSKENGVEGVVTVGFLVMTDGTLKQIKIIKFVDPDLETEALRIVALMPAWIPAEKDGTPIEAPSKVLIPFILEE